MITETGNRKPERFKAAIARYKWAIMDAVLVFGCLVFSNWIAALGWFAAFCLEMVKQTSRDELTEALLRIEGLPIPPADADPYELQNGCYLARRHARLALGMEDS